MSAALHYLERLRKNQLAELAEATALQDYEDDNKPELAAKLDEHLQANRTIFGSDDRLAEYYKRLSQGPRASPVKRESRESRSEASPIKEEAPRSVRRRTTKPKEPKESKEDREPTVDESDVPAQTPTRALAEVAIQLPPSPRVVTEVIDRQTTEWRKSISEAWKNSGVQECSDSLRATLSSVRSVEVIVTILEALGVLTEVLPRRHLTTIPPIDALQSPALPIKIPDVFVLVDSSFWAPVSLWLLTSVLLPLTVAYFFNISLQVAQSSGGPASRTRRSSITRNPQADFDPLSFNIAKALIAYLVYAHGFTFWNIYSKVSVETVNASIPFQYAGILTGAAIGTIGTLYEAILRK
ncbi:hypothetical protein BJX63DRAFT_402508 [Aspergillus granulosus]|uniref:Uncharacterized protein n=1 Tax=Aspergillus granulosus TaxID=176169 RepID=A0ABR4H488_9EURO